MPEFVQVLLYILLFIFCLSVLIVIHELGHLMAAKIFKVYCLEYSIGFGPKLVHFKRKNGETYFSLRVIPFGGFVSMYGEGVELPEGVEIPPERSLNGVKKWKRAIILVAGVTMNALLALVLFFVSNLAFVHTYVYARQASVAEDSIAYNAGLRTGDRIRMYGDLETEGSKDDDSIYQVTFSNHGYYFIGEPGDSASFVYQDDSVIDYAVFLNGNKITNYVDTNLKDLLAFFEYSGDTVSNVEKGIDSNVKEVRLTLKTIPYDKEAGAWRIDAMVAHDLVIPVSEGKMSDFGYNLLVLDDPRMSFGEALGQSFVDFGESSTAIVRALGSLFYSAESWQNVGGIVAIGFESTSILQNLGWGRFIYLWGMISVNLAIVNLIPFPGLDGWQLLVLIVEAAARKKIPDKVKNLVSIIGLALLFGFMLIILVLDLIKYIF